MEDELRFPHALAWDADYWLCRCEGFRVDAPSGRVGVVEGVRFLTRLDRPDALLVRTRPFGQRLLSVPVAEIEHVLPLEQRIVLHQPEGRQYSCRRSSGRWHGFLVPLPRSGGSARCACS